MSKQSLLRRICRFSGWLLIGAALTACGSQLTLEKYNQLKVGQTYENVQKILGDPARCDEVLGVRACTWGDEQKGISINFVGGQVLLFSATNLK